MTEAVQGKSLEIKHRIVPYTRGRGLDLACGVAKTWPHFIGVDSYKDFGGRINFSGLDTAVRYSLRMNVDVICNAFELSPFSGGSMDFVLASHILHLADRTKDALAEWWRVIKQGGYLILYAPCGEENADAQVMGLMTANAGGFDFIENERCGESENFFQVYRKRSDRKQVMVFQEPKPEKTCAVCRWGAFGDMIQMATVLPGLKEQGYHVTVFTNPRGLQIIEHDPNIDKFCIQDIDQIPIEELGKYVEYLKGQYDKVVSFSESTEGALLHLPVRTSFDWPTEARSAISDVSYLEMHHLIAGVPLPPRCKFYPTDKERQWAERERKKIQGKVAVWAVDGSSVHKFWPHMDSAIARIMLMAHDWHIILTGDNTSAVLELGWEKEPRVHLKCGDKQWNIRNTITFAANEADLVIGPETGQLNAVAMEDVPKIVFLSHSSPTNACKYWKNTYPLSAKDGCRACHKLVFTWAQCKKVEKTVFYGDRHAVLAGAECQMNIDLDDFWHAFLKAQNVQKKAA
jgi:ADP-heptose:LPS heptosyltransferase